MKTAKRTLLEAVNDRFNCVQGEPLDVIATMVNARYKDHIKSDQAFFVCQAGKGIRASGLASYSS